MLGNTALGKYRIVRSLGRGSNAEVFLADPIRHGPPVVVKRIHDHIVQHPKFRQLFEAEVRSMANFCHPYAVEFLEAAIDDPLGPCLVMEYVPGITLEALLTRSRTLDAARVGRLLGQFCHALQAAHDAGIIHRDLKPANLMVQQVGTASESLKVMDFGFAGFAAKPHFQLADLTGHGPVQAMGTPAYVSPEMIRGDTVDSRSDIYSVGVILFELLTGRLPFDSQHIDKLLAAHQKQPPPRFAKIGVTDVAPAIETVVQLALSKYPNERQQSARALAHAYSRALGQDIWEAAAPVGWEPSATPISFTPPPTEAPDLPADPYQIVHEFTASMPERMAAAKLRGFVEDYGGQVLLSEPGVILMRLGVPEGYKEKKKGGSAIISWFRSMSNPTVPPGQEPIELELHMQKPDPSQPRLAVVVSFRPMKDYPPNNSRVWRERCDKLNAILRQYLGA
jgi:serine/threonine protein kinase